MVAHNDTGLFYVIQSENNTLNDATRQNLIKDAKAKEGGVPTENGADEMEVDGEAAGDELPAVEFGYPRVPGRWASCIQVVDPVTDKAITYTVDLPTNQSLVSLALVFFESRGEDAFLAVGTAKDLTFTPSYKFSGASIQIYKVSSTGRELEFFHETEVSEPPLALLAFKGKLLAGIGRNLCLYDCGMRSLLRKAQATNCVSNRITEIKTQGSRLVVSDQAESVTYVVHKDQVHPNRLIPFIDDTVSRHTSATEMLDYDTTVGGDKFGSHFAQYLRSFIEAVYKGSDLKIALSKKFDDTSPYGTNISGGSSNKDGCVV